MTIVDCQLLIDCLLHFDCLLLLDCVATSVIAFNQNYLLQSPAFRTVKRLKFQ